MVSAPLGGLLALHLQAYGPNPACQLANHRDLGGVGVLAGALQRVAFPLQPRVGLEGYVLDLGNEAIPPLPVTKTYTDIILSHFPDESPLLEVLED